MGFLRDLVVRVKGDKTSLDATLKGAGNSVGGFSNIVKKLGGVIAAAFGVRAIINFGKEAVKLSAQMEGIRKGFEQIATPGLLDELRKATKGTVTDMQLMSRAVQANNFQIPLKDLAKLLEFASARAVQTGQSVDYLVDSIIMGIGRKSPLILDNLGISAVKLREKLKGVGTEAASVGDMAKIVGEIATEELQKMGGVADTTGVKLQQLGTAWANLKEKIGQTIIESKPFQTFIQWLSDEAEIWSDDRLSFWQKMNGSPNDYKEWKKNQLEAQDIFIKNTNELFPGLIDGLEKIHQKVETDKKAAAEHAEKLRLEAEAAEKAAAAARELAEARKKLGYSPTTIGIAPVSPTPYRPDPGTVAVAQGWVQGQIKATGADQLRGGPQTILDAGWQEDLARMNAELERELTEMEYLLTDGRDMALDLGQQIVEALGEAFSGGDVADIGRGLLMSFANFLSQFGKLLLMAGLGIEAFVKSTATLNAPLAIAAGIAMIVAAGAIKGLLGNASKQVASGASGGGGSYSTGSTGTQRIEVVVQGRLRNKDIYLAGESYANTLNTNT